MADRTPAGPAWVPAFLATLLETGVVTHAVGAAGIAPGTAYFQRRNNLQFAAAWKAALAGEDAADETETRAMPPPRNGGWKKCFLEALAESSNVTASAALANVPLRTVYKRRRDDPTFRALWYQALLEGYEHLEMETLHRLRMGTGRNDRKFDIANALRLLALHKETVARERALREDEDEDAILASLDAKIMAMRAREKEAARLLAETPDDLHDG